MLGEVILELIYALNTALSLLFFFVVLFYLIDSEDLRTSKNVVLLGLYASITFYFLSYFLHTIFYEELNPPHIAYANISILSIGSLVAVFISLFLFVFTESKFSNKYLISGLSIGLFVISGFFSIYSYFVTHGGYWIHDQSILSDIGLFSLFLLAELLIGFTIIVIFSNRLNEIFFPETNRTLIKRQYLYYFIIGISLGGISEVVKLINDNLSFQIAGAGISTIGLSLTIVILVKTRFHIRNIAWEIIALQIEELKDLDVMKDNFIDITSHEIRTPLTVVWGHVELLIR
ncbi:MAG: hypothetical protein ACW964_15235, partial [Candidatus Hodarchaeales archaeon]